ncbi:MAG: glycoside hydrolase family 3 C-terminal domain-containing protein [Micrococcales bacterium]|nr:glycoside hydrolase family 3 C-terminal domain-containing protein [Micrococcales bacterium]
MTDPARTSSLDSKAAMDLDDPRLDDLLARLTLARKVELLTGRDFWSTVPLPEIGLRSMVLSDGPSGVRGPVWDERSPSLNLPSASALSASWDTAIARAYGAVAAAEARRKGVDVVLGPTINLHRSPLGGRHFEAFSEDPLLTAELAAAYVEGLQENGVAATPKHYIANDFETDRFTVDVRVTDRALRELYLRAFESAVVEARAWLVMSSYNSINGATATENELLEVPLNSEWGFDGVVVSDWTAVRSLDSARYSQDLVMPGPVGPWGDALVAAVEKGDVDVTAIDRKVRRILLLAARVGALEGFAFPAPPAAVDGRRFARHAEAAGIVMVQNDGILPFGDSPARIAVIGHNAEAARSQGGGSATVLPERVISPLDGVRAAFPEAEVTYARGAVVQLGLSELPLAQTLNPVTGEPGTHLSFRDADGVEIHVEERLATGFVWFGGDAPVGRTAVLEATTIWTPTETGEVLLGFSAVGRVRIEVDGIPHLDLETVSEGEDLGAALLSPATRSERLAVTAGVALELRVRYTRPTGDSVLDGAMAFSFGVEADDSEPERLLEEAARVAARADAVILVVGTNARVESEGFDRSSLALPGRQDELARRVLAANPRTVVVVNAGSPVELPWADDAAAILLTWFGGQEYGAALGDVLTGVSEPGGRLPTTWPVALPDVPVLDVSPRDGVLSYEEGIHIGYRAWWRADTAPRWWFGEGSGYTSFAVDGFELLPPAAESDGLEARVTIRNTGTRRGGHVVQLYAERSSSSVDYPARWLVGFVRVAAEPGESVVVSVPIPARAFSHWTASGWQTEPGEFTVMVAPHAGADGPRAVFTAAAGS